MIPVTIIILPSRGIWISLLIRWHKRTGRNKIYNVRKKDALRCSVSVMDIASEEIEKKLSMYGQFRTVYLIGIYVV